MFTFVVEVNKNILILFNNNVDDHNVENNDDHYGIDDNEEHHPTDLLYDQNQNNCYFPFIEEITKTEKQLLRKHMPPSLLLVKEIRCKATKTLKSKYQYYKTKNTICRYKAATTTRK